MYSRSLVRGVDGLEEYSITRDKIVIDSVKWSIEENIMIMSISTFNHDTSALFSEAIQEALAANVEGIILDLRSNPGGLLTTAIDIASAWVGYDAVVIERAQSAVQTFKGVSAPRLQGIPTIVLVNGGSASASEIVSGPSKIMGMPPLSVPDVREKDQFRIIVSWKTVPR